MTWVIAHRGASQDCPENTLAAFDEALRQRCDGIELDLQLSIDGYPMVYHDRTLVRAGGGRKRVQGRRRSQLRSLRKGDRLEPGFEDRPMPTLVEILRRYGGKTRLLLELKARSTDGATERHAELARIVCAEVQRLKLESGVMLVCFDPAVLAECRRVAPRIPRVRNLRAPGTLPRSLRDQLAWLHALSVNIRTLTPRFASAVRRTGTPLLTYTCNTRRDVALAHTCGVRGIMTNRPGELGDRIRAGTAP